MSEILLFGSSGRLGRQLGSSLRSLGALDMPVRSEVDFLKHDLKANLNRWPAPKLVVNAAAYTDVDGAETSRETALRANATAVGELATWCAQNGAWLIHLSTDYVFDGHVDRPYEEHENTNPVNWYGETKRLGEEVASAACANHIILRVAWLYDRVGASFLRTMRKLSMTKDELSIADDQVGNPTYIPALAQRIQQVAAAVLRGSATPGIFHLASPDSCSRFEMINYVRDKEGWTCRLRRAKTADFPTPACRPLRTALNSSRIKSLFGVSMPSWRDQLDVALEAWPADEEA